MKNLESGKDKIQKICDVIRKETLEPAKQEAREIIENAHIQAADIVKEATEKAAAQTREALLEIEEKKRLLASSLKLSCRQAVEMLKQKIEEGLFASELSTLVETEMKKPDVIADLIESFMRGLEAKGIEEDFEALIPKEISPKAINALLAKKVIERLKNQTVAVGDIHGGVQLRMKGRQITIDISETVVRELIATYIRRDFRELVFQT
jgi:V/A-type H+-transporting ATPase subunit E